MKCHIWIYWAICLLPAIDSKPQLLIWPYGTFESRQTWTMSTKHVSGFTYIFQWIDHIFLLIFLEFFSELPSLIVKHYRKGCLENLLLMYCSQLKFLAQISFQRGNIFPLINFTTIKNHFISWLQNSVFSKLHKAFPD